MCQSVTFCFTHHDQSDLVLIAQAKIEDLALVSNETLFVDCHVKRGW